MNNSYQSAISMIIEEKYKVVEVIDKDRHMFFVAHTWTPSYGDSVEKVNHNELTGIDITNFMATNGTMVNSLQFKNKLEQVLQESKIIRMSFSNNIKWYEYNLAV